MEGRSTLRPGDTPLYKPYRYVPAQRVWFLSLFGRITGIHFAHFGLEASMVFEGTMGVYERIDSFRSKWVRKKKCKFEMHLNNFLFCALI